MACAVMVYKVMGNTVVASIDMAYIVAAYIVTPYITPYMVTPYIAAVAAARRGGGRPGTASNSSGPGTQKTGPVATRDPNTQAARRLALAVGRRRWQKLTGWASR